MSAAEARTRFETLYRAHRAPVLAFLLRRTDQPADAADVLAEVFTTVWRRIDDVPDGDAALPWLFGVAHRSLANHSRGHRRRLRLVDALASALGRFTRTTAAGDHPVLDAALAELSDVDRTIVTLTAWEQRTPAEIAAILDLTPGTVRTRLHRARNRLRTALEEPSASRSAV
ncbi:RNA polymerase sigma factor [Cryptosporangium aurantiacum]|uniref:RNA polymerase sigma-70 factor, ECF subfamily n=1 Tax=Cryptosporangium aurantiacum TaxID=134849 RepID=A0A1M7RLM3_9ACTN|nr:sigma-70 family RNA polymerase sigma factor [Cryptosporangium aurantiacum]SHN47217.1 RNA polymerase sigma-70 factor, ECF subfamily [Cryptosporangium aurantiacum]